MLGRHWSAGRRYRSLLENAPKCGHEVYGLPTDHLADKSFVSDVLKSMAIPVISEDQMRDLKPDVIFAEFYHPAHRIEWAALEWANADNALSFLINHHVFFAASNFPRPPHWTHSVMSCVNVEQHNILTTQRGGWPESQCHILGLSDADTFLAPVDPSEVRVRLGIQDGQPVVALFIEPEMIPHFMDVIEEGKKAGWWMAIHPHPQTRRLYNADKAYAYYWNGTLEFCKSVSGVHFVADYFPGTIVGTVWEHCASYELMQIADVTLSAISDVLMEGRMLGRQVHIVSCPGYDNADWCRTVGSQLVDSEYEVTTPALQKVKDGMQTPQMVQPDRERWITYDDRDWWKRALALARRLIDEQQGGCDSRGQDGL